MCFFCVGWERVLVRVSASATKPKANKTNPNFPGAPPRDTTAFAMLPRLAKATRAHALSRACSLRNSATGQRRSAFTKPERSPRFAKVRTLRSLCY
jgi:hypothetical protein